MTLLEAELRDIVADLAELDAAELDPDTPFPEIGVDSLLAMEVAVHVEQRFGVRFDDADVKRVQSIADLASLVVARTDA